jgi:hypothetical protein
MQKTAFRIVEGRKKLRQKYKFKTTGIYRTIIQNLEILVTCFRMPLDGVQKWFWNTNDRRKSANTSATKVWKV